MKLSEFIQGRDNNFNLIRITAAFSVLVSHSFALAIGTGEAEPFVKTLGVTPGSIAVDVFFIISGFLVTGSLLTRKNIIEFIWARALRIIPAFVIMVFLTVFCLGVLFTAAPLTSYFSDILTQALPFTGTPYHLLRVFEKNPYKNTVNGSLWTIPYELKMYTVLAVIWAILPVMHRCREMSFTIIIVFCAIVAGTLDIAGRFYSHLTSQFTHLFFMFIYGSSFYVLKDFVKLSYKWFGLCMVLLLLSVIEKNFFFLAYTLSIAYISIFLAYIPSGRIRAFNKVGDYSYGIYIYTFPVQQSIAALIPGISVVSMLITSSVVTFFLAFLSWHLLEKRALSLKNSYVIRTSAAWNFLTIVYSKLKVIQ